MTLNGPTQHPLTHTYAAAGTYTVKYWVEDDHDQADPNFSPQIWYTNVNVVAAAFDPSGDLLVGGDGAPTRVASPERQRRACWAVTADSGPRFFLPRKDAGNGGDGRIRSRLRSTSTIRSRNTRSSSRSCRPLFARRDIGSSC